MDNRQEIATQAITSSSATIMNKLLAHTMVSGTGRTAAISGWQTFGKTGTTDSNKDSWFVGGTPYAVAGVWTGYAASPRSVEDTETAKRVWKTIMSKYLENKTSKTFQFDPNVVSATFCKKTGLLAVPGACSDTGVGWYDKDNMPAVSPVTASSGSRTPSGTVSGDSVVQAPSSSDASSEWLVSSDETDSEPDETSSQTESSSTASHEAPESSPASSATENDVTTGKSSKKSGNAATP
jgi:penicillin-binding protein 1A